MSLPTIPPDLFYRSNRIYCVVILSFRFYFCLGFPAGRRTGSVALDRDEAKSTSSAGVLESLLNLFWWPFLPLFHCEKECLSVPGIRRLFWVVFFLLAVNLVVGNTSANRKKWHFQTYQYNIQNRYTKVRFFQKEPPFLPQTRFEATPLRVNRVFCIPRLSEIVSCRLPHLNWKSYRFWKFIETVANLLKFPSVSDTDKSPGQVLYSKN